MPEDDPIEIEPEDLHGVPHLYLSESLHEQRARARTSAAEAIAEEFGFDEFDALTLASAAADLSKVREAIKRVRSRRYGNIVIKYIELDIVTWRIIPSPENIRFEEERVRSRTSNQRFRSLDEHSPVLVFDGGMSAALTGRLENEAEEIWVVNEHAATIPVRGIENPGLLSVARIRTDDRAEVGVLDATDGFGRTVGAHKALGIRAGDVLWRYTKPEEDQALRGELLALRTNPHDESDAVGEHLLERDRERLRGSVMQRAQVIVGYEFTDSSAGHQDFAQVRRTLVGHIHIEPPKPFTLGTQYALKATSAIQALEAQAALPEAPEFSAEEIAQVFFNQSDVVAATATSLADGRRALTPDEVFVLTLVALRASTGRNDRRARITNAAIRELTGQAPTRNDRSMLTADLALRLGELAGGTAAKDGSYDSRRSALDRAIRAKALDAVRLTREPVLDLLDLALLELDESRDATRDPQPRPYTAELLALALYHLLGTPGRRLIERATKKDPNSDGYISEPNVVVEAIVDSDLGLKQLAQVVLDGRSTRTPQALPAATEPTDHIFQGGSLLDAAALRALAGQAVVGEPIPESPVQQLNTHVLLLKQEIRVVKERITTIGSIPAEAESDTRIINQRGAALAEQALALSDAAFKVRQWDEILRSHAERMQAEFDAADDDARS
jgi:hypothetical protein